MRSGGVAASATFADAAVAIFAELKLNAISARSGRGGRGGLQIAVDDADPVRVIERVAHLRRNPQRFFEQQP